MTNQQTPAPAAVAPNWADAANWLRNNYQDYSNIASLCEGMIAASPYANSTGTQPINWENAMPGGKYTDKWESSRVADYNRGWNDYRKESHKKLKELTAAPATQAAPAAQEDAVAEVVIESDYWSRGHFYEGKRKTIRTLTSLESLPIGTRLVPENAAVPTTLAAPAAQRDAEDAARYRWLKSQASEELLNPRAALSEICAGMRTHWKLPTLICSGLVGGYLDFDASIDASRYLDEEGANHD